MQRTEYVAGKKVKAKMTPDVKINTVAQLNNLLKVDENDTYGFGKRTYKADPNIALNYLLYYISALNERDSVKYKVNQKVIADVITWSFFNSKPDKYTYSRISIGATTGHKYHYFTLIDGHGNPLLYAGLFWEHYSFTKTIFLMIRNCSQKKEKELKVLSKKNLGIVQNDLNHIDYLSKWPFSEGETKSFIDLTDSDDISFSDSVDDPDLIPAPKSVQESIRQTKILAASVDSTPILQFNPDTDINNSNDNSILNETTQYVNPEYIQEEIVEKINNNDILTSIIVPDESSENINLIPQKVYVEAESEVMKETLKEIIMQHSQNFSTSVDELNNLSVLRKMDREENRYKSRMRTGRLATGPHTLGKANFDYRYKTHDAAGRQINPNRSYKMQDDDYLDYAFYGFCREYGTVVNEIMKLPLGLEFNSHRRGSTVNIKAIHFRNTFTHVTGSKASGRMILFYSELSFTEKNLFGQRTWSTIKTEDILQKSVTMYAGDLEELEAADVFYNPTIMSQYDFKNIILGRKFQILYDYYVDLNTQAVKGVVGEDIESVDSIKTKWVKIDDLDLPFFYEDNDNLPLRGVLGVLFMGDYFGGEIETNMTLRVFYNSK